MIETNMYVVQKAPQYREIKSVFQLGEGELENTWCIEGHLNF